MHRTLSQYKHLLSIADPGSQACNCKMLMLTCMQIYTTKLDRSKAKISEKEAARIAREIEGKKTSNPHQAEERGQIQYREMVSASLLGYVHNTL